jgi:hypothetical protein
MKRTLADIEIEINTSMRKLTTTELQQVNDRLKLGHIQYEEIHHEIKDHYLSELEKKSSDEFQTTLSQLNEAFSFDCIKKMEKNLERSTSQLISQMQWEILKFWGLKEQNSRLPVLAIIILGLAYFYLDGEGMTLTLGLASLFGLLVTWITVGKEISFSWRDFKFKSSKVFENEFYKRSGIFYGSLPYLYLTYNNWNDSNPGEVGTILLWIITVPTLLYVVTLIQVALNWKHNRIRTSATSS